MRPEVMSLDRNSILADADVIIRKTSSFTKEDSSRVDSLLRLADSLTPPVTKAELQAAKVANFERRINPPVLDQRNDYDRLFTTYLRSGSREVLNELRTVSYTPQTSTVDASGAVLVPKAFEVALETALRAHDPIFEAARLVETTNGTAFNYPVTCDEGSEAEIVAENTTISTPVPIVWNGISFAACPKWASGFVLYPMELAQDSAYDLGAILVDLFARRFAAGIGRSFVTTLLSEAGSSLTSATAGAVTPEELINLYASVNAAYLPSAGWAMKASTLAAIWALKNTNSAFYFPAEVDADGNPLLMGKRVFLSPNMPNLAASQKAVGFGDLNMFIRRQVRNSLTVHIMRETYLESGQFAAGAFWRMHGHLVTSSNPSDSSPAFRVITQHA